ncbi:hypothetical protein VTN77DRAFT_2645 [Rasamsonia byssochlamydoides]|uniref:uncharacterized protein n=1 Tax=Rasamsonia byssochlamydoides TaxID=89139 RepID=UPI0037436FEF
MTYDDIYYGLPMMLTALESLFFSLTFHWAFGSRIYHKHPHRMPTWRAFLDVMNLSDVSRGISTAFAMLFRGGPQIFGYDIAASMPERPRSHDNMELEPVRSDTMLQSSRQVLPAYRLEESAVPHMMQRYEEYTGDEYPAGSGKPPSTLSSEPHRTPRDVV